MKSKRFFLIFFLITAITEAIIVSLNYYFDYYGVFHTDETVVKSNTLNDRFVKVKRVLNNSVSLGCTSFLWGSSRVLKMDTKITGENTYNLGAPAGMTEDCIEQINIFINNGIKIDTVYIGLDDCSYYRDYSAISNNLSWISYKDELNRDIETYSCYLLMPSNVKRVIEEKGKLQGINYLGENGMFSVPYQIEENIEKNVVKYVKDPQFLVPTIYNKNPIEFERCLDNLREISEICKKHKIKMKIFFNPQHMTTYLADDMELMNRFKKELVKISSFWDFSGVNYVTANNYFWYETSHPRAFICDKILDTVSGQNKITWVPDFGVYVTPDNVDAFCEKAVRDREAYDPDHEQWIPTAEERAIMIKRVNYPW